MRAGQLGIGEHLRSESGPLEIGAIRWVDGTHQVFNLEVAGNHTYLVGTDGVLSHNACVDTRINVSNEAWEHVKFGHFDKEIARNRSVFTRTEAEIREILQRDIVVDSPVQMVRDNEFKRVVEIGEVIGISAEKFGGGISTKIVVYTDKAGNLLTAYPF